MASQSPPVGLPVALDAFGADAGPEVVAEGAAIAALNGIAVRVFGPEGLQVRAPAATPVARDLRGGDPRALPATAGAAEVELVACTDWIGPGEDPVPAVRSRPDASIVRAAAEVAAGRCCALVSPGSTGATMTAALFALKRLQGVHRPALAAVVPIPAGVAPEGARRILLLDCGANVEVRPQHLIQFAFLGAAFSEAVLGLARPRVGLLSVGEEATKGTPDVVDAHAALAGAAGIRFVGNVEGHELLTGKADVVVTDGFTGNVILKTLEGTAKAVAAAVGGAARSNPVSALGGVLIKPAMGGLRAAMDPNSVGGAILLGLRGVTVVAHGGATAEGIANAIRLAHRTFAEGAIERTRELLAHHGATRALLR